MDNALSTISSSLTSHRGQLALTALASGTLVGTSILAYQKAKQHSRIKHLKSDIPYDVEPTALTEFGASAPMNNLQSDPDAEMARKARRGDFDEDIILEQLARNRVFLGDDGLKKVRSSFVIIVGCGGVGSWAATMLLRSGISRIRLIDFDQVTLSSLNRHAVANLADVGTPKVHALRKHLEQVCPWAEIEVRNELWNLEKGADLLAGSPDYVVDAIDNIATKVDLLEFCVKSGLKVVSSMGAGCKSDPTRVNVGDISESTEDPLSRATRTRLRKKGIVTGIPVVFSTEKPGEGKAALQPLNEEEFKKGGVNELGVLPDFRVRILPVLGTMPAIFGLCVANHVLVDLAGYPYEYSMGKNRTKLYDELHTKLVGQESRLRGGIVGLRLAVTEQDIGYLVEEVYKGRSVVSRIPTRLGVTRWEPLPEKEDGGNWGEEDHRIKLEEIVVMTKEEVKKHEELVLKERKSPEEVWGKEVCELVAKRRKEVQEDR